MNAFLVVLIVIGGLVVLLVVAIVAFLVWAKWRTGRGLARQRYEIPSFPAWAQERGLTYTEFDNALLEDVEDLAPFRNFATPGAFCRAFYVFEGTYAGHEIAILQLTVYAAPHPDTPASARMTVAVTSLPHRVADVVITPERRGRPSVHARGDRATSYLSGPLTLERAQAVADRLAAYADGVRQAA
jgi:hypothetical protein